MRDEWTMVLAPGVTAHVRLSDGATAVHVERLLAHLDLMREALGVRADGIAGGDGG